MLHFQGGCSWGPLGKVARTGWFYWLWRFKWKQRTEKPVDRAQSSLSCASFKESNLKLWHPNQKPQWVLWALTLTYSWVHLFLSTELVQATQEERLIRVREVGQAGRDRRMALPPHGPTNNVKNNFRNATDLYTKNGKALSTLSSCREHVANTLGGMSELWRDLEQQKCQYYHDREQTKQWCDSFSRVVFILVTVTIISKAPIGSVLLVTASSKISGDCIKA
jgi:hypothetical protein